MEGAIGVPDDASAEVEIAHELVFRRDALALPAQIVLVVDRSFCGIRTAAEMIRSEVHTAWTSL